MARDNREVSDTARIISKKLRAGKSNNRLKPYLMKARWIAQSIHPFINLRRVFYAGIPEGVLDKDDEDIKEEGYTADEVKAFEAIMKLERGFREVVDACAIDTGTFAVLIKQVNDASGRSRSDDVSSLKAGILEYIHENPKKGSRFSAEIQSEHILSSDSKELHGFRNVDTADHLCPLSLKSKFENDPINFMEMFEDEKIEITEADLPSFLYQSGTVYDPDDEVTGLFRGFLLVRVFRHIFTGPKSALGVDQDGRNKNKSRIFQLKAVTPRTIAYACVQTYIALSNMTRWKASDGLFHLNDFYDDIVSIFEDNAECSWAVETLEWWNNQIPGLCSRSRMTKSTIRPTAKEARIPAAKRIGTQIAAQMSKRPVSGTICDDDAADDGRAQGLEYFDLDRSSTEPSSGDEEGHQLWEEREHMRKEYRQHLSEEELLWEREYREERERCRQEEEHHEEAEYRHREEGRREGSEHRRREEEHGRREGECRRRDDERREEAERRKEAERRHQEEIHLQEERRQEKERRRQEAEHQEARRKEADRKEKERRQEADRLREEEDQDGDQETEQPMKLPRVNLVVIQKKTTRSSKKRLINSDETEPDLQLPRAKRVCQSQPVKATRKRAVS